MGGRGEKYKDILEKGLCQKTCICLIAGRTSVAYIPAELLL